MAIEDVIERLEQAETGSAELDREIGEVIGSGHEPSGPAAYTRSLDAAITLMPIDLDFGLTREGGFWSAWYAEPGGWITRVPHYSAPQPALALCIAALQAHSKRRP